MDRAGVEFGGPAHEEFNWCLVAPMFEIPLIALCNARSRQCGGAAETEGRIRIRIPDFGAAPMSLFRIAKRRRQEGKNRSDRAFGEIDGELKYLRESDTPDASAAYGRRLAPTATAEERSWPPGAGPRRSTPNPRTTNGSGTRLDPRRR